jgi:hypothetical protein
MNFCLIRAIICEEGKSLRGSKKNGRGALGVQKKSAVAHVTAELLTQIHYPNGEISMPPFGKNACHQNA